MGFYVVNSSEGPYFFGIKYRKKNEPFFRLKFFNFRIIVFVTNQHNLVTINKVNIWACAGM